MHTRGPWEFDTSDGECIYGTDVHGERIVVVYELNTNADDKRLIKAAPDLLYACIAAFRELTWPDTALGDKLKAAIDKATS